MLKIQFRYHKDMIILIIYLYFTAISYNFTSVSNCENNYFNKMLKYINVIYQ